MDSLCFIFNGPDRSELTIVAHDWCLQSDHSCYAQGDDLCRYTGPDALQTDVCLQVDEVARLRLAPTFTLLLLVDIRIGQNCILLYSSKSCLASLSRDLTHSLC